MTEKTKAPLTVAKGVNNTQTTEEVKQIETKPSFEQLQKENEELKRKLSAVPEDLENKIEYFKQKRLLIGRLDSLIEKKDNLLNHLDQVAQLSATNNFTNDRYSITINNAEGGYNSKEVFKMQNPVVIGEVISFIIDKIEVIQGDLQKQIEE